MVYENDGISLTFIASVSIPEGARVKIKSGSSLNPPEVELASSEDENSIGHSQYSASIGDAFPVKLIVSNGIHTAIASGSIPVGAKLYAADDGKVSTTVTSAIGAVAYSSATAPGDRLNIIYI